MTIYEISAAEYEKQFAPIHIYNSVPFSCLNADKATSVRYLSFADTKPRFGIILGERDNILCSPFSAPFGSFTMRGKQNLQNMEAALQLLTDYADTERKSLKIALPPLFYDETQLSKWVSVFLRAGFRQIVDLDYYVQLERFPNYMRIIDRSARNHLNHAMKEQFKLVKMDSGNRKEVARAYEVIRCNREERGYELRMTFEQVWQTVTNVVKADFFVLEHEGKDVAAAQIFHVADGIAQVIYWGDIRQYSELRPMNYLTYAVLKHYHEANLKILDIGPSTSDGIPNYGLCEFKEDTGCDVSPKYWFSI